MAKEPFLINPPKRKPQRRSNVGLKRHRILAFEGKNGGLFTSGQAKIVRKGIKLNPRRRFRSNPLGEELMFVGLNPFKKGGHTMATRKRHKKRSYKKNPARRRYHRNPMSSMNNLIPMVLSGGVGALVGRAVPQYVPILKDMGVLGNIASKIAIAIGGAMLIDKTVGKRYKGLEDGWIIGSLSSAAADLSAMGIERAAGMNGLGAMRDNRIARYRGGRRGAINNGLTPYGGGAVTMSPGYNTQEAAFDNPFSDSMGAFVDA